MMLFILFSIISLGNAQCPTGYEEHPLVLLSMDGFRYDYLQRGLTPHIQKLMDGGASVPYIKASYPTITFPNHYAIVTGLYPESHGIIDNHFYDPITGQTFDVGTEDSLDEEWWGGDPIWNTVVKQGKKSAAYFWPGSEANVEGMHPTYWYPYNESVSFEERVNQILEWLTLPQADRPSIMTVYFNQPDGKGHSNGPNSIQVNEQLVRLDLILASLVRGIEKQNLSSCVNIILMSDHGMTACGKSRMLDLSVYDSDLEQEALVYEGELVRMYVSDNETADGIRRDFACKQAEIQQFSRVGLPTRYHYSNNVRIGDVLLDLSLGYQGFLEEQTRIQEGGHGYDNYYAQMQPIFIANGPEFKIGVQIEPFQNIEVYNLLCHLVGVVPSPNNGTIGSLYSLLQQPPDYPATPPEVVPDTAAFPDEETLEKRLSISECSGDLTEPEDWIYGLNMSMEAMDAIEVTNLPWGIPQSGNMTADVILLYHDDHITGFSQTLKMPLWVSFTVNSSPRESPELLWSSDVRLDSENTPTCASYESLATYNVSMQPLFPSSYSQDLEGDIPYMVSNAIPMNSQVRVHWSALLDDTLGTWYEDTREPINVVVGPLFDANADSLVDNMEPLTSYPVVPSHLFMIATRCLESVKELANCNHSTLDAISFIFPQNDTIPNCMDEAEYALLFSAKVKDVELGTGLQFYPSFSYQDKLPLQLRIHSQLWDT